MGKRKFQLTMEQTQDLHQRVDRAKGPRTRLRLQAVLWYGTGRPLDEIQSRLGCSRSSVLGWCQAYQREGPAALASKWQGGNNARLTPAQLEDLCDRISTNTPRDLFGKHAATPDGTDWTAEDLHKALKLWYGVVYQSKSSYYRLLKKCLQHLEQLARQQYS